MSSNLGVNAKYLNLFLRSHIDETRNKTWQIVENIVKPGCKKHGAPLVECLDSEYTSPATVFVSHAYSYNIEEVFQVLLEFEEENPNSYFWFDPFSLNQVPSSGEPAVLSTETLEKVFGDQIKAIGSVLIVASPWDDPAFLSRAWCLFELYMAVHKQVKLTILCPERESTVFLKELEVNWRAVYSALGRIDARKAEAREQADLDAIFASVERTCGFDGLNTLALEKTRKWVFETVSKEEKRLRELGSSDNDQLLGFSKFLLSSGILFWQLGEQMEAERVDRECLAIRQKILGDQALDTLAAVNQLALLLKAQGKLAEATPLFELALSGTQVHLGPNHADVMPILNNLASLLRMQGKYEEAEPLYRRALRTRKEFLGDTHPDTLMSQNNLSFLLFQKAGDEALAEAQGLALMAVSGREKVLSPTHPDTLESVFNLACVLMAQKKYKESQLHFRRALIGREVALGRSHPGALTSAHGLAMLLFEMSEDDGAGECEALARRCFSERDVVLGSNHPSTLTSVHLLAAVLLRKNGLKDEEGRRLALRAFEGRKAKLGPTHPETLLSQALLLSATTV